MTAVTRNNWLLLLLASGLSLALLLTQPQPAPESSHTLSDLDIRTVRQIELSLGRAGQNAVQLQYEQKQWQLTSPLAVAADAHAVEEILRLATMPSHRQLDPTKLDLSALGLAPPLWRVRLDHAVFEIGGTEAISGQRYVLFKDQVHLIDDINTTRLDTNYADLVVRKLVPEQAQIRSLSLPDAQLGQREWLATQTQNQQLFQHWQHAEAQWLVRPTRLDYDDVHSRASLTLQQLNGDIISVDYLILSNGPQLQLIRPDLDLMYMLPQSAKHELLKPDDA